MMICENCGKEHDGSYGSGRFCSASCRASYTNRKRGKLSELTKRKISESLKHSKVCKYCGQEINEINNHDICIQKRRIFKSLEKFGLNRDSYGSLDIFKEYSRVRDLIRDFYVKYGSNDKKLKDIFNYKSGPANFHKLLHSLDIDVRSHSEATSYSIECGNIETLNFKNTKYKLGWHTSWNNSKHYLRSSYELDFAKQLDRKNILYYTENIRVKYFDTLKNKFRIAVPDFYIPDENLIVEVKSYWTLDRQEMKDKVKAYKENGYNFKLILEHEEVNIV